MKTEKDKQSKTIEKGPLKEEHINQYGKQNDDVRKRGEKTPDDSK